MLVAVAVSLVGCAAAGLVATLLRLHLARVYSL